jgi:predicted nucleic acid-binding Zn ribbon protein
MIRILRRASQPRLDVPVPLINECAEPHNGQHDETRNQVSPPADTSDARLPVRRLESLLARRVDELAATGH